ncbi:MAG: O-antigen polymerase [Bacteroidales bacterium]|jgi:oligosaccharide repeat unit polymerase|nr:O-antigen ligase [Bacteroidales bacterium]MDD2687185.1 O-antigen ligase [Bacteroidales bacterium]MDD3329935.1 O-antigen ligase [Bacteroidales bacterium]MDD3691640.1 O-antigen ligase [Bacteroidales bacterium]MDD4044157.1 O-antigen ligase [Bacteroidales bacterium]
MNIITIVLLFSMLIVSYKLTRNIIHPAVITNAVWAIILTIYNFVDHGLFELSDKFYFVLLIWTFTFSFFTLLFNFVKVPFPSRLKGPSNKNLVKWLIPITIVCLCLSIISLIQKGLFYNPENLFAGIRAASVSDLNGEELLIHIPFYISIANTVSNFAFLLLLLLLFVDKTYKITDFKIITLFFLIIIYYILRSNKTVMAQILLSFFCILIIYRKLTVKKTALFFAVFFILMMLSHLLRRSVGGFNFINFITAYLLAPLPAFDGVLSGNTQFIHSFNGEYTFRFLVPFLQLIDADIVGNPDPFNLYNWTKTPININVYTIMFSYYVDFGLFGIFLFAAILGTFWGILYQYMRFGYSVGILVYVAFFYMLVFQFFSDSFFQFFFITVTIILLVIALFIKIKFNTGENKTESIDNNN